MKTQDRAHLKSIAGKLARERAWTPRILDVLSEGPATASEIHATLIVSRAGNDRQAITNALARLERKGRIRRRPMFTPAGRRVVCRPLEVFEVAA